MTEAVCGTGFLKSTVSNLVKTRNADLAAWRERPIGNLAYPVTLADATYQHVRVNGQMVSQAVLIVMGIREDDRREVITVAVSGLESGPDYDDLFRSLRARGLRGVEWLVAGDHAGADRQEVPQRRRTRRNYRA